jgi:hypothetical protein
MLLEYGPKCITILRYLSEAGKSIPLDAHTRIIRKLNVPQLLVALMEDGCGWIENDRYYLSGKVIRIQVTLDILKVGRSESAVFGLSTNHVARHLTWSNSGPLFRVM